MSLPRSRKDLISSNSMKKTSNNSPTKKAKMKLKRQRTRRISRKTLFRKTLSLKMRLRRKCLNLLMDLSYYLTLYP